jgi:hypothetical protein
MAIKGAVIGPIVIFRRPMRGRRAWKENDRTTKTVEMEKNKRVAMEDRVTMLRR